MFKQFLQASALQFVQIDGCRVGSVNENLAVLLMAHKFQGKRNKTDFKKKKCLNQIEFHFHSLNESSYN